MKRSKPGDPVETKGETITEEPNGEKKQKSTDKLVVVKNVLDAKLADALFKELCDFPFGARVKRKLYGREITVPRDQTGFGYGSYYYSGKMYDANAPGPHMAAVIKWIQDLYGTQYAYALVNLYRDGKDGVSWHADDEQTIDQNHGIVSLSLGAARNFGVRKMGDTRTTYAVELPHNSMVVMPPGFQKNFQHCVTKTKKACGPRVNITFRALKNK